VLILVVSCCCNHRFYVFPLRLSLAEKKRKSGKSRLEEKTTLVASGRRTSSHHLEGEGGPDRSHARQEERARKKQAVSSSKGQGVIAVQGELERRREDDEANESSFCARWKARETRTELGLARVGDAERWEEEKRRDAREKEREGRDEVVAREGGE
jgi:hypothetical protein